MCGIAGALGPVSSAHLASMSEALGHRGPDDEGRHTDEGGATLIHRRLSIVDPEGGHQPLGDGAGSWIVINGEIYNAPDLRDELADGPPWTSRSDSEVALRVLGSGSRTATEAARLQGMFAFALRRDGELLLGRDPVGIKPLYVGQLNDATVFASEIKAFPPGTTDLAAVTPGTVWSSKTGESRVASVPSPDPLPGPPEQHTKAVRAALQRSVDRHLMADVPVGAFLSGGLDSSAICALMARRVENLHTFAVGFEGSPDLAAARVVAQHLGTEHHERIITRAEVAARLPEIVWSLESTDPDVVPSAVPTWFVAEFAARYVKVVLTGEGADEMFAGYRYHADIAMNDLHEELCRGVAAMHDINLQRADRMTMGHSLEARVPFLDLDFIETALRVPPELCRPEGGPEKWVLREAVKDLLPEEIVWRTKSQFDEGSGVGDLVRDVLAADWPDSSNPLEAVLASVATPEMCANVASLSGRWQADRIGAA